MEIPIEGDNHIRTSNSKTVLVISDWFSPGYKAGGPIRSCVNFANSLWKDFDIYVLTTDTDFGDSKPYIGIATNKWLTIENKFQAYYLPKKEFTVKDIKTVINELNPDFIYLNSMFSKYFTIYPLWLKWRNKIRAKIILAPRGMLKDSALYFGRAKKMLFLTLLKQVQIYKYVYFHATDEQEAKDIRKHIHPKARLLEVSNLPPVKQESFERITKEIGRLELIYLSRIHPIKNLLFLLEALKEVTQLVNFTIIGTVEDSDYWSICKDYINQLPANISTHHVAGIAHNRIDACLKKHHLFALATTGENFGHAIFESFLAGRPVLISDQTPWQELTAQKAGWVFPLNDKKKYTQAIEFVTGMDQSEYDKWSRSAWIIANKYIEQSTIKEKYLKLFS